MMNLIIDNISDKIRKGIMDCDLEFSSLEIREQDQPLFILTAEKVEDVRNTYEYAIEKKIEWLNANIHWLDKYDKECVQRIIEKKRNLLTIIKQWQDEHRN